MEPVKLKAAQMHEHLFYPGIGEIKKELSTTFDSINKEVTLSLVGDLVHVGVTDKGGKTVTLLVPITNFKFMVLA